MTSHEDRLTDRLLEAFLTCKRKPMLYRTQVLRTSNDYLDLTAELDKEFRSEAAGKLMSAHAPSSITTPCTTTSELSKGHQLILNAALTVDQFGANIDAIQATSGHSSLGRFYYQPIRFCRTGRSERTQKLLLAFSGLIVGLIQGKIPDHGFIIRGNQFTRSRIQLTPLLPKLKDALEQLREQPNNTSGHPVMLNNNCATCEFQAYCQNEAEEGDHLSLLGGISEKEIARHNSRGIFTTEQLSYTFRPKKRSKRAKPSPPPHSYALQALAVREQHLFLHGMPDIPCREVNVYFDIEGIPDRNMYYLIGMLVQQDDYTEYRAFWADGQNDMSRMFEEFLDALPVCEDRQIFHFGSYETTALRKIKGRLGSGYLTRLEDVQR